MPVLEAMAAGVPVLASNRAALPEVCGDAALLVDPEDVSALAAGLEQLMGNQPLREKLTTLGLKRAAMFSWEQATARTWEVYQGLLI